MRLLLKADQRGSEVSQLSVKQDFQVEVRGDHIIVTFVGTSFCVNYPKPKKGQALLPSGFSKPAEATSAQVAGGLGGSTAFSAETLALRMGPSRRYLLWVPSPGESTTRTEAPSKEE